MHRAGSPAITVKATIVLATLAGVAALLPVPAAWIESAYSSTTYRWIQPLLTRSSNATPFAWFDAAILSACVGWVWMVVRDARRVGAGGAALRATLRTVSWAATAYLAFLALWGLNYRRRPLTDTLAFDRAAITTGSARRVARISIDRLNTLAADAHRTGWAPAGTIDPALRDGLLRATRDLGLPMPAVARPKRTLLDPYFRRAGVEGMTDPYFLETLIVGDLLPFERPFVVAHEWSHLAGLADESAASFAGWLACVHGSPSDQYSGWLFLYEELTAALPASDQNAAGAALGPVPRADLAASRARIRANVQPRVSAAAWRAYDSYLKSNHVAAGTRSYDEVVQLVLGTRFDDSWTPARR